MFIFFINWLNCIVSVSSYVSLFHNNEYDDFVALGDWDGVRGDRNGGKIVPYSTTQHDMFYSSTGTGCDGLRDDCCWRQRRNEVSLVFCKRFMAVDENEEAKDWCQMESVLDRDIALFAGTDTGFTSVCHRRAAPARHRWAVLAVHPPSPSLLPSPHIPYPTSYDSCQSKPDRYATQQCLGFFVSSLLVQHWFLPFVCYDEIAFDLNSQTCLISTPWSCHEFSRPNTPAWSCRDDGLEYWQSVNVFV